MDDVPDFMPLSEFNLRPDKQIVPTFLSLMREDGYIYAEDLVAHKVSNHSCGRDEHVSLFAHQVDYVWWRQSHRGEWGTTTVFYLYSLCALYHSCMYAAIQIMCNVLCAVTNDCGFEFYTVMHLRMWILSFNIYCRCWKCLIQGVVGDYWAQS